MGEGILFWAKVSQFRFQGLGFWSSLEAWVEGC